MKAMLVIVLAALAAFAAPAQADRERHRAAVTTTTDMLDRASRTPVGGASWLIRENNAVTIGVGTSGLRAGAAYTIWVAVFNRPWLCEGECDSGDLGNPRVRGSLFWGTGFVAADGGPGIGGIANVSMRLRRRSFPGQSVSGNGLENVRGAEIHLIVRNHGDPIPGRTAEQLTTAAGACEVSGCIDEQIALHFPPPRRRDD